MSIDARIAKVAAGYTPPGSQPPRADSPADVPQWGTEYRWGIIPADAPMFQLGEMFGALGAFGVGAVTGDEALTNTAIDVLSESREQNQELLVIFGTIGRGKAFPAARAGAPLVRGGASLENITAQQALRIQNAANRTGTEISLVGSRARGTATSASDWDYVINANARVRNSLSGSLPGAGQVSEGVPRNLDIFRGPLDETLPSITFFPAGP
jgi:hypothetical protein